jgi:hypothetical protein
LQRVPDTPERRIEIVKKRLGRDHRRPLFRRLLPTVLSSCDDFAIHLQRIWFSVTGSTSS